VTAPVGDATIAGVPLDVALGLPLDLPGLLSELRSARDYSESLVAALDPDQIAWRPHVDSSAIGWHLGHQSFVAHVMLRNLTAAEPSIDPALDRLFDSATPEPARGDLPPLAELLGYRRAVARSTETTIGRIVAGEVGAPEQLSIVAAGLLRAVVNHEYQHDAWIAEVRAGLTDAPAPVPVSNRLTLIEGYWVLT
jgi:hypothetical protein